MPLPRKWNKKKKPPVGFDYVEPVLEALENELRDKVKESNMNKRKTESMWPVHQINWQKTRYIYDLYYTHKRIDRRVYDYCIDQNLIDAALIAKWKKSGYERLCSTYVINPMNYKFGTTSICRVPLWDRSEDQKMAQDPTVSRPVEDRRFQFRTVLYYSVYKSRTCDSFVSRMLCCRFKLPLSETIKKLS